MATKKKTLAQQLAADPARRAKYLANPGLRSKLPDSMLTPAQRAQRRRNTENAKPVTKGSDLTRGELARESRTATDLRYGPAERQLGTERGRAEQQGRDMGSFYDQYLAELQKHTANTQQINAQSQQQLNTLAGGLQALDQGQATAQQGEAQAQAAQRGATANLGTTASDASLVRQQGLAGMIAQAGATGAATSRYASTQAGVVAPGQKLQQAAISQRQVVDLGQKLVDLATDKGAFDADYRSRRTADEQKNVLATAALTTGMEKALLASDDKRKGRITSNRNADASRAETKRVNDERIANERERIRISKAKAKGDSAAARTRNRKVWSQIETSGEDARDLLTVEQLVAGPDGKPEVGADGKPTGRKRTRTPAEARREIREKIEDADIANAAIDMAIHGYILPARAEKLRRRGIAIPKSMTTRPALPGRRGEMSRIPT